MTYSSPLLTAFEFFEKSKDCGISFAYRGPFMDDLTSKIIDISENTIADNQGLPKVSRKVSFLLVECFQNIVRHGEETPEELAATLHDGLFTYKNIRGAYVINSINLVDAEEIADLEEQVEYINGLDSNQLKQAYRNKLQNNELSGKGGAGLGLLELARKSGQKIKYKFEKVNDKMSLFHQQILFVKGETEESIDHIEFTNHTFNRMHSENLLLQYKGDFSQKSILPLLKIVEDNMGKDKAEIRRMKKVGHMLIEILQNISKHGQLEDGTRDGVFLIGSKDGNFFIEAGNPIEVEGSEEFQKALNDTLSSSDEELDDKIKTKLLESFQSEDKLNSGIGLLEIAKSSTKPLHYNFQKSPDGKLFFTLKAFV